MNTLNNEHDLTPDEVWRERMKAVRVVEFWTGYPNKPTPTKEEKLKLLAQYRSGDVTLFQRRLGAYSLPNNISDEQLINWDGSPLV